MRLRTLREAEGGLSQERLAARAGLHRTFVGKLERGEHGVTVEILAALCAALDMPLSEFFEPFRQPVKIRGPLRRRRS